MTRTTQNRIAGQGRKATLRNAIATALVGLSLVAIPAAQAQQAIGVPFVGRNHLSFSVTELSRDGIGEQRAAVFGGIYGRTLGRDDAALTYTVIARAAARPLDGMDDGIVDAGFTLAATHDVRGLSGLSVTGAAGLSAMVWGSHHVHAAGQDRGRAVSRAPLSAGAAFDIRVGRATIAPFATLIGAYTRESDYVNDRRVATTQGWKLGHTAGVSVRFRETVLSLSGVNREQGMPHKTRTMFSAGMSW